MTQPTFFDVRQVRLLDGLFKDAQERDRAYLRSLDAERLLHNFRVTSGLPSSVQPYSGWESPEVEVRGHFVGHYLSACALMVASTDDLTLQERVAYLVAELACCQDALPAQGYTEGYLSAFPEVLFDRVERRDPAWAPYYTMHKIMAGLLDAHVLCGNAQALAVLLRLARWVKTRVDLLTQEQMQINLLMEFGGMNEVLANLYAVTRDPEHLRLSLAFNDDLILDPLKQGVDLLDRQHANTQIPKLIGLARQYELTGDSALRDAAQFFWERVAFARSYVIGGHSDDELFFPVNRFADHLSPVSAETCNTHNMLKLTRHIFGWSASARAMDFYERALLNHILASQDPQTGGMLYFASLKPGHFKVYSTPENSFWCCTGTGIENHARYGEAIYARTEDALYVNLFIPSEVIWAERGLMLRQETRFPESDKVQITLRCSQPTSLALCLRCPAWADGVTVTVNGQVQAVAAEPESYCTLEREWYDGDSITFRCPMTLRRETLPGAPDYAALLVGPVVLAGALGTDDMPDSYLSDIPIRDTPINDYPTPLVPTLAGDLLAQTTAQAGVPLTYRLSDPALPLPVELIPFYRLHHQRYTVYWHSQAPA